MAKRPNTATTASPSTAPEAPVAITKSKSKFVTVASKLPMHVELQLCDVREVRVTGQFGATSEKQAVKTGVVHVIRGTGHPVGQLPEGFPDRPEMNKAKFSLTRGVPREFFEEWLRQNKDTELVRNGLIMAHDDDASLSDMTADYKKVDSGLGPLDPKGDPRNPKPLGKGVSAVTAEIKAA